jgi:hypothetical protein
MGSNNGNHVPRVKAWRAWCAACKRHLVMNAHRSLWPDELRCPFCTRWCKVVGVGTVPLKGDVICPPGSGRNRVEER